jgi:hypothetical protein
MSRFFDAFHLINPIGLVFICSMKNEKISASIEGINRRHGFYLRIEPMHF